MTFKKYSMSPSALEEYRKLQLDLVDASDKMENWRTSKNRLLTLL